MAISNITPATNSVVAPGDSFSFDIATGYTALVIKVLTNSGEEYAYDYALGGVQAGYTVTVANAGGTDTYTVSRAAGWDREPTAITVTENQSGVVSTEFAYYLTSTAVYPEGMQPYNNAYTGELFVTVDDVQVRRDVGWVDFEDSGFDVTDMGEGKVKVALDSSVSGEDEDAIHDNVANEISAITEKTTPAGGDLIIIEDSAAGYVKKKVQITNLPGTGGSGDSPAVYLGEYDVWEETEKGNPDGNGQLVYDNTDYIGLSISYTDKNAVDYTTLWQEYGGQTIVLVDASGDRSYWRINTAGGTATWWDLTTAVRLPALYKLFDESGFSWGTNGTASVKAYAMGIGYGNLGGAVLPSNEQSARGVHDYASTNGDSPVYDAYNSRWRFTRVVAESSQDPQASDDISQGYTVGQLWVNTNALNLWVLVDSFTGDWQPIIQNEVQYISTGAWTFDDTAGTPNANGEIEPNASTGAATTSLNIYNNDAGGNDFSTELLSLVAGSQIDVYDNEAWNEAFTVTGPAVDNTTYVTVPVTHIAYNSGSWPNTTEGGMRLTIPGGFVRQDGTTAQFAASFLERSSEVNTAASAKGEVWLQGATGAGDQTLKFTNESGDRFALVPHVAAGAPGVGDDVNDGHEIGQIWVDTSGAAAYICIDNSAGAADWNAI